MGDSANPLESVFKNLNLSSLSAVAGVTALVSAMKSFSSGVASIVNSTVNVSQGFETIQTGLTTIMQSAEKGKEAFEDLRKFSNETTFGVDELASASTQLLNVGMQFDEVKKKLTQLGDISGGSKEKFADLVDIFAKIQSTGRATQREIQQLAMRGLPIIQMLKDMGVEGTATAEDISQAFEQMAGAGGQFHGAMSNILDTIEGKKGEVQDFGKEVVVAFGEATSIVDIYKVGLGAVRDVMQKLSEALNVIAKNPFLKALTTGVFIGAIVGIGTTIMGVIIPALKAVAVQLGIVNALTYANPIGAIIGLITTAVTALTAVSIHFFNEAKKQHEELVQAQKEQIMLSAELRDLNLQDSSGSVYSDNIQDEISKLAELNLKVKETAKEWEQKLKTAVDVGDELGVAEINKLYQDQMVYLEEQGKEIKDKIRWLRQEEIMQQKLLEIEKQRLLAQARAKDNYKKIVEQISEEYNKLGKTTLEQQLAEYQAMRNASYKEYVYQDKGGGQVVKVGEREVKLDKESLKKLDELIADVKRQIAEAKGGKSWAERFKDVTGTEVSGASADTHWANQYMKELQDGADLQKRINDTWGEATTLQDDLNAQQKILNELMDSYIGLIAEGFDETSFTMQEMRKNLDEQKQKVQELKNKQQGEEIGGMALSFGTSVSGDLNSAVQGFKQGGIWGAIINTFLNAIANVIQGIEGADEVLNPITTAMQTFKPVLVAIIKLMTKFQPFVNGVMNELSKAFQQLLPLLDAISTIMQVINGILSAILLVLRYFQPILRVLAEAIKFIVNLLFGWLLDGLNSLTAQIEVNTQAEEENANALEKINEQYRNLTQSLREYEEYYLQKRRELNAENEINKLTAVNDMIITPEGKFSTHPDDYIMAMKKPYALGGNGGTLVNVTVKNEVGDYATATATQTTDANGNAQLMISISKKIAQDVATGSNGWDNALRSRDYRLAGSRLSM